MAAVEQEFKFFQKTHCYSLRYWESKCGFKIIQIQLIHGDIELFCDHLFWISENFEDFGHLITLFVNLVQFLCISLHKHMCGFMYKEDSVQLTEFLN